jgi:hypothetical protein
MTTREHQKSKDTGGEAASEENGGGFGDGGRHAPVGGRWMVNWVATIRGRRLPKGIEIR